MTRGLWLVVARLRAHWLALAAAAMLAMSVWQPPLLGAAEQQNQAVLTSAVAAYAVLRTINATVSTAKETTFGVGIVGSVQAKPAMVLDPIDDTVRRVADAVFLVAAISGFLAVAMAPICTLGAAVAAVGLVGLYVGQRVPALAGAWLRVCRALAVVGLSLSLLLPVGYGLGGMLGDALTAERLASAMARLEASETTLSMETDALNRHAVAADDAQAPSPDDTSGVVGGTLRWLNDGASAALAGATGLFEQARAMAPDLGQIAAQGERILISSVDIMAVYALRLLVFPSLMIFVLYICIRAALSNRVIAK